MNTKPKSAWYRIALSLTLAYIFVISIYITFTKLSAAAANDPLNQAKGDAPPMLLDVQISAFSGTVLPPYSVTINGPTTGLVNTSYTFTATVNPLTATGLLPLTYTWQASGQDLDPPEHTGGPSDTITFTWDTIGRQTITVTASNAASSVTNTHVITIRPRVVYLPLILNCYPPIPALNSIANGGDGNYTVSWNPPCSSDTTYMYTLQEDDNPAFSSPYDYPPTSMHSIAVTGRVCGAYYYRVKATDDMEEHPWSNTETAVVNYLTIDDFDDGQDPNAIGGSISWAGPCVILSPGGYDLINAYGGSGYGYRLSYDVTPTCYATWQTGLLGRDYSGFSTVTFQIKGASGNERPNIYLQNTSIQRHYVDVEESLSARQVTRDWRPATISLDVFEGKGVNLERVNYFQIVFEWEYVTGTVYVDEIRFECPTR